MNWLINIDVPDLQSAVSFYAAALDLKPVRFLDDDVVELAGGPCPIYLLQKRQNSSISSKSWVARQYSRHWTPVHLDFVVEDLDQALKRAEQAGAIRESECVNWRGSKCISFSDPFGHGFCLIEFTFGTYTDESTSCKR